MDGMLQKEDKLWYSNKKTILKRLPIRGVTIYLIVLRGGEGGSPVCRSTIDEVSQWLEEGRQCDPSIPKISK